MNIECPACNSRDVAPQGQMPHFLSDNLNGQLGKQLDRGRLYLCRACSLQFRSPMPSQDLLRAYYSSVQSDDAWDCGQNRPEWYEIARILKNAPGNRVLDVGCFRGDLLNFIGDGWDKYGIEMSTKASEVARSRGIKIAGTSIEDVVLEKEYFGAITMIDVIEHLPHPVEAISKLVTGLSASGKLIISTGNTQSLSYRMSGARYYYGAFPEHITFYSPKWFSWVAPKINCTLESVYKFSHNPAKIGRRVDEALKNSAFALYNRMDQSPFLNHLLPKIPKLRNIGKWENCWWTSAKDHMIVVLGKK